METRLDQGQEDIESLKEDSATNRNGVNALLEWAEKAQQLAKKIDKKNITDSVQASIDDVPNYYLTSLYLAELKERNAQISKLKMQMSRFNDDF